MSAWQSNSKTHVGHIRQRNEDTLLERSDLSAWAVADGMGGYTDGAFASKKLCDHLEHALLDLGSTKDPASDQLTHRAALFEAAFKAANAELLEGGDERRCGTTGVVLTICDNWALYAWVGDSRLYRYRRGAISQLTIDHSVYEEIIASGESSEQARTHPDSEALTRGVGMEPNVFVDFDLVQVKRGDRFLLCSDGIYRHVTAEELGGVLTPANNRASAVEKLEELTLSRGAKDNLSVIVIDQG